MGMGMYMHLVRAVRACTCKQARGMHMQASTWHARGMHVRVRVRTCAHLGDGACRVARAARNGRASEALPRGRRLRLWVEGAPVHLPGEKVPEGSSCGCALR
jgi:hypothetical protein